ncbi:MAG: type II toxin-antitoxin system RelE/ParE family toxin [Methanomicrobiales archaeon]|nr:type II toxin-antitoxin system RelE/ParE family toxin [Methanomicrobiales archaeon]
MNFRVVIHPDLINTCRKLRSKSPVRYEQLKTKIRFHAENPESGKPLHPPLKGQWRVHLGHFVLFYRIDAKEKTLVFLKLLPHDEAYQ